MDGTITSSVYTGDTSNPYGSGDLTFTYMLNVASDATDSAGVMTAGHFAGFSTDVSYNSSGGVAPFDFSRSSTAANNGDTLTFNWGSGVSAGQSGDTVVVQTDAIRFQWASGAVIDGEAGPISTYAPVPEPGIGALVAGGLGVLFVFLRGRNSK